MMTTLITLKIEFSGGLELLFSNIRSHRVQIPSIVPSDNSTKQISLTEKAEETDATSTKSADVTYLMYYLRDHLLKERVELFMEGGTV